MNERKFKLAIVGFGGMGNWHRELIERIEHLSVKGICDIKKERQDYARELGLEVYRSLKDVLEDPEIDIVLCAAPNDVHKEIVIQTLEAGKHIVCEKPAAIHAKDFEEMMAAQKTSRLFVHQNRRWDEDYLTIRKVLDENLLGQVFQIESRVHGSRGIPGDWRGMKEHGGGVVLDWGVHILDQALCMIEGKVKNVYAAVTHVTNELVDDGFMARLMFENGVEYIAEVGTSNFIPLPRWYVLGCDGTAVIRDWELSGEVVRVTDWNKNDAMPVKTAAGLTKTMAPRTEDTIAAEALPVVHSDIRDYYRNVMAVIDGVEEQKVKNEEVLRVLRLIEAIFVSAKEKQVVDFE
ncbi:MAG TPA: Gfo/Idh/MocA family oxidoreductase [Lachnospiraceae bacterium]|nr:Gfo/Idh/MocA family oxidoreductase [Lachnospiraceae bacterium]